MFIYVLFCYISSWVHLVLADAVCVPVLSRKCYRKKSTIHDLEGAETKLSLDQQPLTYGILLDHAV